MLQIALYFAKFRLAIFRRCVQMGITFKTKTMDMKVKSEEVKLSDLIFH